MKLNKREERELKAWAKQALHGLDESACFVGVHNTTSPGAERPEFLLQLGHCILSNKPIIIPVPYGVDVPPKLQAVADRIVRYDPDRPASLRSALMAALTEMGINKQ